jgi:hypothetical protein
MDGFPGAWFCGAREDVFMFKRLVLAAGLSAALALSGVAGQAGAGGASEAEGHALAARLLAKYQISDLFDDVTGADGVARLRHRRSGMICNFPDGDVVKLMEGGQRGDIVGCGSRHAGMPVMLTTFPAAYEGSVEHMLDEFAGGIAQSWPEMTPTGAISYSEDPGLPRIAHRNYTSVLNGHRFAIHIDVAVHGDWVICQAAMGPIENAEAVQAIAEAEFRAGRRGMGRSAA